MHRLDGAVSRVGGLGNALQNRIEVGEHFLVVKAQYPIAVRVQMFGAALIVIGLLLVHAAVHFNDETMVGAAEVEDVRPDRVLTPELDSTK